MIDTIKNTFGEYTRFVTILAIFLLLDVILPLLFNIMGIPMNYFMVYLFWFNVLLVMYFILPSKSGNIFM